MADRVEFPLGECGYCGIAVTQVEGNRFDLCGEIDCGWTTGQRHDLMARVQETMNEHPTDEAGRTGYEHMHGSPSGGLNQLAMTPCYAVRRRQRPDHAQPLPGDDLPRQPKYEPAFLTANQVRTLADQAGTRRAQYRTLVLFLAYGGVRWGEAAALRARRVDLELGRVDIVESVAEVRGTLLVGPTKTHKERTIRLPSFLLEMLAAHLPEEPDALVFTAPEGGPLRLSLWRQRYWRPALLAAGLPATVRVHDLRHTCASLLAAQGASAKEVQEHLGHSSIGVTMNTYTHLFPDAHDRLADRLDAAWQESVAAPARPQQRRSKDREGDSGAE